MPRCRRAQAAGARAAKCPDGAHAGRTTGDRGRVLLGIDACRSRGSLESAPRHRQDANPFRTAQAAAGVERGGQLAMHCDQAELVSAYAVQALPTSEVAALEAHLASCPQCRRELDMLRPIVDAFVSWPTDVLRPAASLQQRLARRIAAEGGGEPVLPAQRQWSEPAWEEVAPGISCKLLVSDAEQHRISMLVRLAPGGEYPPHTHAGVEE